MHADGGQLVTPKTPIMHNAGTVSKALRNGRRLSIEDFPADHVTSTHRYNKNPDGTASV
jgi:hypothetical protein